MRKLARQQRKMRQLDDTSRKTEISKDNLQNTDVETGGRVTFAYPEDCRIQTQKKIKLIIFNLTLT